MIFLSDSSSVDIRALVSQDIDRATYHTSPNAAGNLVERIFGVPELVLALELALIIIMAGLFIVLVVRFRKTAREQNKKLESERRMGVKCPPSVSKAEIERILGQIATEKVKVSEMAAGNYFIDNRGKLDSGAAIHEMARTNHIEADRLNFAISYASQASKQSPQTGQSGAKFKEAFTIVDEDSDLNVLARQLNMGRGELELILALKKSKIANSKTAAGIGKRRTQ